MANRKSADELREAFKTYSDRTHSSLAASSSGAEPPGPSLTQRVEQLEVNIGDLKGLLNRIEPILTESHSIVSKAIPSIESELTTVRLEMAEIKGRVSQLPTMWQTSALVIAILAAAFAILRFGLTSV